MGFSLGSVVKAVTSPVSDLLNFGGKKGPQNPYSAPNLSYLLDTSKLDYLKNPSMYNFLTDTSKYDFLKNPVSAAPVKTFASTYTPPGFAKSDQLYSDLIGSTSAPSSVDQVRTELNNDQLDQTLQGIDQDTAQTVGNLKGDFLDRGLSGPGMISDIEANALAKAYGDADKTKAAARTQVGQSTLDLLKNRETAANAARTAAAGAGLSEDQLLNQIEAQGATTDVNAENTAENNAKNLTNQNALSWTSLLNSGNQNYASALQGGNDLFAQLLNARDLGAAGINSTNYNTAVGQQYQYQQPGFLDNILRNIKVGFDF